MQGLVVSAITGVGYSVVQSQILRLPNIRKKIGLPYLVKQDPPKLRETVLWARQKFQDIKKTVEQKGKEDLARRKKEQIQKDAAIEMEAIRRLGGAKKQQDRMPTAEDQTVVPSVKSVAQERRPKTKARHKARKQ